MIEKCERIATHTNAESVISSSKMKSGFPTYIYNNSAYLCIDADRLIISGEIDDSSEITEFAKMFGCNCVLCDVENSKFFTGDIIQRGQTMCKLCEAKKPLESTNFPEYSQIYKTLESDFSLPCYEEFLVNLHRMVQSNSGAVIEYNDCIAILQTAGKCAYISVIHTKPEYRRQGKGFKMIDLISQSFDKIYLYKEENENDEFYKKAGFTQISEFEIRKL